MEIKNKKTFSLALDHWQLCELSILKSSGFDGDLQINLCVTLTFLEECRRNPPPQDARIVWKQKCVGARHVRICTWTSQSPTERTACSATWTPFFSQWHITIVWRWRCVRSGHVRICTWTSQSPTERTACWATWTAFFSQWRIAIVWRWRCVRSRHVRICTWTS